MGLVLSTLIAPKLKVSSHVPLIRKLLIRALFMLNRSLSEQRTLAANDVGMPLNIL